MTLMSEVLADAPAMYLRHNDNTGTVAADATANNNAGTYTNVAGYTLNQPSLLRSDDNQSVRFIKAGLGYVTVPDANTLDLADTWTLEAWIKLIALGQGTVKCIVSKQTGAYAFRIGTSDKIELLRSQTSALGNSLAALPTVGPHHVVATKTGATRAVYLNGADAVLTGGANSTCADNTRALLVGVDGNNGTPVSTDYFDGWIDEVAVYPTVLSAARILAHYNAGIADPPSFISTHWRNAV